ncbi:MAG: APC family permease [Vicinamibacterales bacterium]
MTQPALRRALGRWDLTAIGVNQVIGGGIFLIPSDVARQVGSWGPAAFVGVGVASLLVALCFAEAASRFDRTGGPLLPARAAFGRFAGFEVGWMMWFTRVTSQASISNGLALALAFYWPGFAGGAPRAALITGLTLALAWINVRGIRQASWAVNAFTWGKLLPLFVFIAVGVWYVDPARFASPPPVSLEQAGTAMLLLIFAYGGYEVVSVPAGEAARPARDIPFASVMTVLGVTAVMTLTAIVATGTLPGLAATRTPIADAAAIFMGPGGSLLVSLGAVVSMTGNCMGQVIAASRSIFALAEHGDLPRFFARVHPVYRTPSNAILFSTAVALVLALSGSFTLLAAVSAVGRLVIYLTACGAVLQLRRPSLAGRAGPAGFTIPFGPTVPVLAIIITLGILAGATTQQFAVGGTALGAGGFLYLAGRRRPVL